MQAFKILGLSSSSGHWRHDWFTTPLLKMKLPSKFFFAGLSQSIEVDSLIFGVGG